MTVVLLSKKERSAEIKRAKAESFYSITPYLSTAKIDIFKISSIKIMELSNKKEEKKEEKQIPATQRYRMKLMLPDGQAFISDGK